MNRWKNRDELPDSIEFEQFRLTGRYHTTYNCGQVHFWARRAECNYILCSFTDAIGNPLSLDKLEEITGRQFMGLAMDEADEDWDTCWAGHQGRVKCQNWFYIQRHLQHKFGPATPRDAGAVCQSERCDARLWASTATASTSHSALACVRSIAATQYVTSVSSSVTKQSGLFEDFLYEHVLMKRMMRAATQGVLDKVLRTQDPWLAQSGSAGLLRPPTYSHNVITFKTPSFAASAVVPDSWYGYREGFPELPLDFNSRFHKGTISKGGGVSWMPKQIGVPPFHYSIHRPTNGNGFHVTSNKVLTQRDAFWNDDPQAYYHWYYDAHGKLRYFTERRLDQTGSKVSKLVTVHDRPAPEHIEAAAKLFARWLKTQRVA